MGLRNEITKGFLRLALNFERLYPRYFKFMASRILKGYRERGLISSYRIKSRRKGKYHYVFEIDLCREPRKEVKISE